MITNAQHFLHIIAQFRAALFAKHKNRFLVSEAVRLMRQRISLDYAKCSPSLCIIVFIDKAPLVINQNFAEGENTSLNQPLCPVLAKCDDFISNKKRTHCACMFKGQRPVLKRITFFFFLSFFFFFFHFFIFPHHVIAIVSSKR